MNVCVCVYVCVRVCVCFRGYSLPHWSDMGFTVTLVFMTYLCVSESVSECMRLCVCVFGHVQACLISGQTYWLRGRTVSYCIMDFKNKSDRQTDAPTDRYLIKPC